MSLRSEIIQHSEVCTLVSSRRCHREGKLWSSEREKEGKLWNWKICKLVSSRWCHWESEIYEMHWKNELCCWKQSARLFGILEIMDTSAGTIWQAMQQLTPLSKLLSESNVWIMMKQKKFIIQIVWGIWFLFCWYFLLNFFTRCQMQHSLLWMCVSQKKVSQLLSFSKAIVKLWLSSITAQHSWSCQMLVVSTVVVNQRETDYFWTSWIWIASLTPIC